MLTNKALEKIQWLTLLMLAFCFVFAFKLPIVGNSAVLALVSTSLLIFLSQKSFSYFLDFFRDKFVIFLFFLHIILIFFSIFVTSINGAFDFQFVFPLVNISISLIGCLALAALLRSWSRERSAIDLLISVFLLQVFAIFLMLLLPEFRDLIQSYIRSDDEVSRMSVYNGIRGLGISGSVAFGLAVSMGALGLLMHYWFATSTSKNVSLKAFIVFFVCIVASITTGRTAVLGFVLGLVFYIYSYSGNKLIVRSAKQLWFAMSFGVLAIIYILSDENLKQLAFFFSRYAFQFVWSYFETGQASISSLQVLDNMYFVPPNENWLLGDGYYYNSNGSHYLYTDAGYMRFLLYFGVIGSVLFYISFIFVCFYSAYRCRHVMPMANVFFLLFCLMVFIFHYKGDVVMYGVAVMKIFYIVVFFFLSKAREYSRAQYNISDGYLNIGALR